MDSVLSWRPQITGLSKNYQKPLVSSLRQDIMSQLNCKTFIFFFIFSVVSYGVTVWGLTHPTILDRLCKLQNKVIRVIEFKDNYAHVTPLFYDLKFIK